MMMGLHKLVATMKHPGCQEKYICTTILIVHGVRQESSVGWRERQSEIVIVWHKMRINKFYISQFMQGFVQTSTSAARKILQHSICNPSLTMSSMTACDRPKHLDWQLPWMIRHRAPNGQISPPRVYGQSALAVT